jgi:DNA-binding XRE family transcriptional regulator
MSGIETQDLDAALIDRVTKRIRDVIALANKGSSTAGPLGPTRPEWFAEDHPTADVERMAVLVGVQVQRYVSLLVRDPKIRAAVAGRDELLQRWPLEAGYWGSREQNEDALCSLGQFLRVRGHVQAWPTTVAFEEVATALDGVDDDSARNVAKLLRMGRYTPNVFGVGFMTKGLEGIDLQLLGVDEATIDRAIITVEHVDVDGSKRSEPATFEVKREIVCSDAWLAIDRRWSASAAACVVHVEKMVRSDAARGAIPISARKESKHVLSMLHASDVRNSAARYQWDASRSGLTKTGDSLVLLWDGKRRGGPLQLSFAALEGETLDATIVQELLRELSADGVRDWITLHAMAAEQGQTGTFRWTWREHREIGGYDRRRQNQSDAELARAVMDRLRRLKSAELRAEKRIGNKIAWTRIGDHGLIDILAGIDDLTPEGRLTTVAKLQINRAIYGGASVNAKKKFYTLIDKSALALPTASLHLFTQLSFGMTSSREKPLRWRAATLWEYAGVREGIRTKRKRWPDARRTLEGRLEEIAKVTGELSWRVEGDVDGPDAIYEIKPPAWFIDRVVHKVTPELGPSTAGIPRTGAELRAWRQSRDLSQSDIAAAIGVPQRTLSRHEAGGDKTLPEEWIGKLAAAVRGA